MGIKRRLIWLVLGLIFCWFCTGCGEKASILPSEKEISVRMPVIASSEVQEGVVETGVISEPTEEVREGSDEPEMTSAVLEVEQERMDEPEVTSELAEERENETSMEAEIGFFEVEETSEPEISLFETVVEETEEPSVIEEPTLFELPVKSKEPVATVSPHSDIMQSPTTPQAAAGHTHSGTLYRQEATCGMAGVLKESCETCNAILREEVLPPLGHDFTKSVWELPTCQKGGYYNNICNRCGQVECVTQEPLPHEVEDIVIQEGNCMEDTVIQHVCKNCGVQVQEETRYTLYDVHLWMQEVIDGTEMTYCQRCGIVQ